MIRILIIISIVLISLESTVAQSADDFNTQLEEVSVDSLITLHKAFNNQYNSINGYRVQIFKGSGNSALENAEIIMAEFTADQTNTLAYISFMEPYYRIRVGDFKTRLEALNFLKIIKGTYPSSFVIKDNIELTELPKYQKTINYEQEDSSGY